MKQTIIALSLISFIVMIAIGYGLVVTGGPIAQRQRQLDQRKVEYLSMVAGELQTEYSQTGRLPQSLAELKVLSELTQAEGEVGLADVTYRALDKGMFELCMEFATTRTGQARPVIQDVWEVYQAAHGIGRQCFTFEPSTAIKVEDAATSTPPVPRANPATDQLLVK